MDEETVKIDRWIVPKDIIEHKDFTLKDSSPLDIAVVHELWRRGDLEFLLQPVQKRIRDKIHSKYRKLNVVNCARRLGKSYLMYIMCVEECLSGPNRIVRYGAPFGTQTQEIVLGLHDPIFASCPEDIRPKQTQNGFLFKNGSRLILAGFEKDAGNKTRGVSNHFVVLDEVRDLTNLEYLVSNVIMPTLQNTKGKLVMISTPPDTAGHPFTELYIPLAIKADSYYHAPFYMSPTVMQDYEGWKDETLRYMVKPTSGDVDNFDHAMDTDAFKLEYLADYTITNQNMRVVPEYDWTTQDEWVSEWTVPEIYQPYVAMDPGSGGNSHTGIVFAAYDWRERVVVIQDELLMNNQYTSDEWGKAIAEKEQELWGNRAPGLPDLPKTIRVMDNNIPMFAVDFDRKFDQRWKLIEGKKKKQFLADIRNSFLYDHIRVVRERCTQLDHQLTMGIWNKNKSDFAKDKDGGHLDLLMALIYLNQVIEWDANPYNKKDEQVVIPLKYAENKKRMQRVGRWVR